MKFVKEQSYKYLANVFQLLGVACSSVLASKIFNAVAHGSLEEIQLNILSLQISLYLSILGLMFLALGWYIMYRLDSDKAKRSKK